MSLEHQPESIIRDRYKVIDILGQGSSGITYRVEDLNTKQEVALKALSLHRLKDWKQIELFEREAEVLAKLNHPAIPKYLDYFQIDTPDNRAFYIVQALAPGKPLSAWVESGWRTKEREVKDIARQVLSVLNYLHSLDPPVIHRDIKPENIIRSRNGKIFLVDFGAVQNTYHNTLMQGSTVVGTYGYMAPEQFRGKAVPATDLYSLGATLLYLLTHRSPAELPQDTLKLDFRASVNTSEEFTDWLDKILEPSLEYRYASVNEALAALDSEKKEAVKQREKRKKLSKKQEGVIVRNEGCGCFIMLFIFSFPWLPLFLVFNFKSIVAMPSYSPHWRVLSKLKYHPLNVCHSPKSMSNYIKSGGRTDINFVSLNDDSKQLSKCLLANKTMLNHAAREDNLEIIKLLSIDNDVDVNYQGESEDFTALHWAVFNNNISIIKLLMEKDADINIVGTHPFYNRENYDFSELVTPISLAFEQENNYAISILLDYNRKIDINDSMKSKIKKAIWTNDLVFIKIILSNDNFVNSLEKQYFPAGKNRYVSLLNLAKRYKNESIIELIEEKFSK